MAYDSLREANMARQREWDAGGEANNADWRMNELAGEVGEVCNVLKKINRERVGVAGSRATVADLAEELADVVICIDLYMMTTGGREVSSDADVGFLARYTLPHLGVHLAASLGRASIRLALTPTVVGEDQHHSMTALMEVCRGIAQREGIDLGKAVAQKFNATSNKMGLETKMTVESEARPNEPLPEGVWYDAGSNTFRKRGSDEDMGIEFWRKWRGRNHQFPITSTGNAPAPDIH